MVTNVINNNEVREMCASCNKQSTFILKLPTNPTTKPFSYFSILVREFFLMIFSGSRSYRENNVIYSREIVQRQQTASHSEQQKHVTHV